MDITGYDKAEILAALYNSAKPQGMGFLHFNPEDMPVEEAREILKTQTYFDYVKGRVMKIMLDTNELRTDLYNRDNGDGACERIISKLTRLAP